MRMGVGCTMVRMGVYIAFFPISTFLHPPSP